MLVFLLLLMLGEWVDNDGGGHRKEGEEEPFHGYDLKMTVSDCYDYQE
jgi:hypothetical protein